MCRGHSDEDAGTFMMTFFFFPHHDQWGKLKSLKWCLTNNSLTKWKHKVDPSFGCQLKSADNVRIRCEEWEVVALPHSATPHVTIHTLRCFWIKPSYVFITVFFLSSPLVFLIHESLCYNVFSFNIIFQRLVWFALGTQAVVLMKSRKKKDN